MKPVILYKQGCDPYKVDSQEALTYHLNQGWVEDQADLEAVVPVIPPTPPYDVLKAGKVLLVDDSAEIKSLKEALAAKDQVIADMQADFEEEVKSLNAMIKSLKDIPPVAHDFGLPVAPVAPAALVAPPAPLAPDGPTVMELRAQLDAAGVKHTPRDNKTTLMARVAALHKE